jgi:hypothetical protein
MKENVIYIKVISCKHFAAGELEESTFCAINTIWHGIAGIVAN